MSEVTHLDASSDTKEPVAATVQTAPSQDPYEQVSVPENSLLSQETLAAFKQAAAQAHLPADALTQWLRWEDNRLQQETQTQAQARREQLDSWARETQENFGPNWQEEVSRAVRAADMFGGPQLRQLLEETGLGNHPVMVRTFHAVAQCISEDVIPGSSTTALADKTFTEALYGKN